MRGDKPNNEHGTHDHEYHDARATFNANWLNSKGEPRREIRIRVETAFFPRPGKSPSFGGDFAASADYMISGAYYPDKCHGWLRGEYGGGSQCGKNAKYTHRGLPFCGLHYPPKLWERKLNNERKYRAKVDAKWEQSNYHNRLRDWREKVLEALETIAQGELNDPAGYAQMILDEG